MRSRSRRIAKILAFIFIIGPIAIFVFGMIVMLLWNNVLAPVLNISTVTFWQALGILVLSKILFGSFSGGKKSRSARGKEQMMWGYMSPDQKEKFREEWRRRCGKWGAEYKDPGAETGSISTESQV